MSDTPTGIEDMRAWQVLSQVIPRRSGVSTLIARHLHVTPDMVRRWWREPASDEAPNGTGFPSPLDKITDLIDVCFLKNPRGTAMIPEYIGNHYRQLVLTHERAGFGGSEARRDAAAEVLQAAAKAVNSLNIMGATDETLCLLVDLNEQIGLVKEKVQAELAQRRLSERASDEP